MLNLAPEAQAGLSPEVLSDLRGEKYFAIEQVEGVEAANRAREADRAKTEAENDLARAQAIAPGADWDFTIETPSTETPLADEVEIPDGRTLRATQVGLPNTCTVTGQACTIRWFAETLDAARSGRGLSENHVRGLLAGDS